MKLLCGMIGTIVVGFMAFESWTRGIADSVVDPVRRDVASFKEYSKIHQERVERDLLMIRSQNEELKNILIKR